MTGPADIEDMIVRTALGDRDAFSNLYDATSAKLFGICLRVLKNRSDAEDVLQDVFARIWHKADTYRVTGHSPMTWLITIARNLAIDRLRSRERRAEDGDPAPDLPDRQPGPEATAIAVSDSRRIVDCFEELPADRAAAVKSAYLDGDTYQTLADRYAVPLNTMRTWLRRSLMTLRECLSR